MTTKELKELARACRQVGITHYKSNEIEFTLSEQLVKQKYTKKQLKTTDQEKQLVADQIESDGWDNLSLDQKLMWSSDSLISSEEAENQ